jgi:hypothetical protein
MPNASLNVADHVASIGLVPPPVKVLSRDSKLNHKIGREIVRLNLAALFAPEPKEGFFVVAHDDSSVRAA